MKTPNKIERSIYLLVIISLLVIILQGNRPIQEQNNPNLPEGIKAVMFYDTKTGKLFAKGYDYFTYGLDSSMHTIDVQKGENSYYFVLYDMSIQFKITKYDE